MTIMTDKDQLSQMQLDILELELQGEELQGEKISRFRQMHPSVTETGYHSALLVLLGRPAAYQVRDGRYGNMLRRLDERHKESIARRYGLRLRPRNVSTV